MPTKEGQIVDIVYTNGKGETRTRRVRPISVEFRRSPYYPGKQWLMLALDLEKGEERLFAMTNIHGWSVYGVIGPTDYDEICRRYEEQKKEQPKQATLFAADGSRAQAERR